MASQQIDKCNYQLHLAVTRTWPRLHTEPDCKGDESTIEAAIGTWQISKADDGHQTSS